MGTEKKKFQIDILKSNENITNLTEVFVNAQDIKSSSKEAYLKSLRQFQLWLLKTKPNEINRELLLSYKKHLEASKKKPLTISNYMIAARAFLKWAGYPEATEDIKVGKRDRGFRRDPLTVDQVEDLLDVFDRSSPQGRRDFAIINLMLRTGLRTLELINANIGDIRQVSGQAVLYILGKGRSEKSDYVVLTPESLNPINDYLVQRRTQRDEDPIFTSLSDRNPGMRLTTRSIRRIVKDYLAKINIKSDRLTAHSLRHTAVTLALLGGSTLQEAMAMARHQNINTTMIYAHNVDRIGDAAEKKIDKYLKK